MGHFILVNVPDVLPKLCVLQVSLYIYCYFYEISLDLVVVGFDSHDMKPKLNCFLLA